MTSGMIPRKCKNCNKDFYCRRSTIAEGKRKGKEWGVFCSKSCKSTGKFHHKYNGGLLLIEKVCVQCTKKFTATVADTRYRKVKYCSYQCTYDAKRTSKGSIINTRGYRMLYMPNQIKANGKTLYYPEHRYVVEQNIGRKLKDDEVIHHKNRNKLDNRIENLVILTASEHSKVHAIDTKNTAAKYWTPERRKEFGEKVRTYRKEVYWSNKKGDKLTT